MLSDTVDHMKNITNISVEKPALQTNKSTSKGLHIPVKRIFRLEDQVISMSARSKGNVGSARTSVPNKTTLKNKSAGMKREASKKTLMNKTSTTWLEKENENISDMDKTINMSTTVQE